MMDDIAEQQDVAKEISEAISNPVAFGQVRMKGKNIQASNLLLRSLMKMSWRLNLMLLVRSLNLRNKKSLTNNFLMLDQQLVCLRFLQQNQPSLPVYQPG
jgi:hypothetical protein